MPTYSYRCPKCGHEYQKRQRISDDTRAKCPECSARGERLISAGGGILFRGSGFYHTDYKVAGERKVREDAKKAKKADKKSDKSEPPKKGDTKSGSSSSSPAQPGKGS